MKYFTMASNIKADHSTHHLESSTDAAHDHVDMDTVEGARVFMNSELVEKEGLKGGQHGRVVLIPQPSDDPLDPLNWSPARKLVVLAVVVACSFLPDYGSVTGAATLAAQAK